MSDFTKISGEEEEPQEGKQDRGPKGLEDRLLKSRTIALFEPITPRSSRRVVTSLLVLDAEDPKAPVTLLVNSPGGSVDDGFVNATRFGG